MRYFDRLLSEALNNADPQKVGKKIGDKVRKKRKTRGELKGLTGRKLQDALKDRIDDAGKDPDDALATEKAWDAVDELMTDDNAEEFKKYYAEIAEKNKDNKNFKKALRHRASRGDNLVLWMLKYLVQKSQG